MSPAAAGHFPVDAGEALASDFDDAEDDPESPPEEEDEEDDDEEEEPPASAPLAEAAARESVR